MPFQTYEAEIKMPARSQRADVAESSAESEALNGLPRVRSKGYGYVGDCAAKRIFVRVGALSIPRRVRALIARICRYPLSARFRELRWQRGEFSPSLWQDLPVSEGGFFVLNYNRRGDNNVKSDA